MRLKSNKKAIISVFAILILIFSVSIAVIGGSKENTKPSFKYGVFLKQGIEGGEVKAVKSQAQARNGDFLKINFSQCGGRVYYIIRQTATGEYSLLNSALVKSSNGNNGNDKVLTTGWLKLEGKSGVETFFLAALKDRQPSLDKLFNGIEDGQEIGVSITKELENCGIATSTPRLEKKVKKPIESGAVFRGAADAWTINNLQAKICGEDIAAETITIVYE